MTTLSSNDRGGALKRMENRRKAGQDKTAILKACPHMKGALQGGNFTEGGGEKQLPIRFKGRKQEKAEHQKSGLLKRNLKRFSQGKGN